MTKARLLLRSLWFYRRQHTGVVLGVFLATAVITGSLLIGDSVRQSLREMAERRLGGVNLVMPTGDRLFQADLAERVGLSEAAAMLQLQAVAVTPELSSRVNQVQLLGIDSKWSQINPWFEQARLGPGEAVVNDELAHRLGVSVGDTIVLRLPSPSALPAELPVGFEEGEGTLALRVRVVAVAEDRFSLRTEPGVSPNAYVSRAWLAEQIEQPEKANLLVSSDTLGIDAASLKLSESLTLDDLQLEWRPRWAGAGELRSPRVFLDDSIDKAVADFSGERVLTYFVNQLSHKDRSTPYSMVTAVGDDLQDDEITINQWLADDLGVKVGEQVMLVYFVADSGRKLEERSAELTVKEVVPIEGRYSDRSLVPDFPGLDKVEKISDWDGGVLIDRGRIREKDEDYWDQYRATPKAFVSLATGQRLWSNRYGSLTSIRFEPGVGMDDVRERVDVEGLGFVWRDVRGAAIEASRATVDFGSLFLMLSVFIIGSAVLLTGLLFAWGIEQRASQVGVLRAVGWRGDMVRRLLLFEGLGLAVVGSGVGVLGGIGFTHAVLAVLGGRWAGAVSDTAVGFHATPLSLAIGFASGVIVSLIAMWLSLRYLRARPIRALLNNSLGQVASLAGRWVWLELIAVVLMVLAVLLGGTVKPSDPMAMAGVRFGMGALVMLSGLCAVYGGFRKTATSASGMSFLGLAMRGVTRRAGRSLAVIALLAGGVFLVLAVSGFTLSTPVNEHRRDTGTGGFALVAEATLPMLYDPSTGLGQEQYGFDEDELPGLVALRVSSGDEASCLNLNRVARPKVWGVSPQALQERNAFAFAGDGHWGLLNEPLANGVIPAIADANTAMWSLKLRVGDTLVVQGNAGQPIKLQLVATLNQSILQGGLVIDEKAFQKAFPDEPGYRAMMLDPPSNSSEVESLAQLVTQALADQGVEVTNTQDRLAAFNAVQNTYIRIFQSLGGLGVLLASAGLGVVVLRNLQERQPELAILRAVGFDRPRLRRLVLIEHAGLLVLGLSLGLLAAGVAVVGGPQAVSQLMPAVYIAVGVVVVGVASVLIAVRLAMRGGVFQGLRNE